MTDLSNMAKAKRDLSTFDASHTPEVIIPGKIRAALERMRKEDGEEAYAYEYQDMEGTPFAKRAGLGISQLAGYRKAFKDHIVIVKQDIGSKRGPRFVWFATAKAATKARKGAAKAEDFE